MARTSRQLIWACVPLGILVLLGLLILAEGGRSVPVEDAGVASEDSPPSDYGKPRPIPTKAFVPPDRSSGPVVLNNTLPSYSPEQGIAIRLAESLLGGEVPWELLNRQWESATLERLVTELREKSTQLERIESTLRSAADKVLRKHYADGNWVVWDSGGRTVTIPNPEDPSSPIERPLSPWEDRRKDEAMLEAGGLDANGNPEKRVVRLLPEDDIDYANAVLERDMKKEELHREVERILSAYIK